MNSKPFSLVILISALFMISLCYIGCEDKTIVESNYPTNVNSMTMDSLTVTGDIMVHNEDSVGGGIVWYGGPAGTQQYSARVWGQGNLCFHSTSDDYPTLWLGQNRRVGIGLEGREPLYTLDVEGTLRTTEDLTAPGIFINSGHEDGGRLILCGGQNVTQEYRARVFTNGALWFFPADAQNGENAPGARFKLQLNNEIIAEGNFHCTGNITAGGNCCSASDRRFKTHINKISNSLDRVSQLSGVSFDWNRKEYPEKHFTDEKQIGLIAQDVKDIIPEVVYEDNDGYYYIAYNKLVPVLIEAIKEQQIMINELRKKVDELGKDSQNL